MTAALLERPAGVPAGEEPVRHPLDDLADYLADIIAPELAAAVARRDREAIDRVIGGLTAQEIYGLLIVQADRTPRPALRPEDGEIDDVAIQRAADGYPVLLTRTERDLAVHYMHQRGLGHTPIMARLRLSGSTVKAILARPLPAQIPLFDQLTACAAPLIGEI
jgi:hypothetical protein